MRQLLPNALCTLVSLKQQRNLPGDATTATALGQRALDTSHASRTGYGRRANTQAIDAFALACRLDPGHVAAQAGLVQACREARVHQRGPCAGQQRNLLQAKALNHLGAYLAIAPPVPACTTLTYCDDLFAGPMDIAAETAVRRTLLPQLSKLYAAVPAVATIPPAPGETVLYAMHRLVTLQPWTAAAVATALRAHVATADTPTTTLAALCRLLKHLLGTDAALAAGVLDVAEAHLQHRRHDPTATILCVYVIAEVWTVVQHDGPLVLQCVAALRASGCALPAEACGYEAARVLAHVAAASDQSLHGAVLAAETAQAAIAGLEAIVTAAGDGPRALPLREMAQRALQDLARQACAPVAQSAVRALLALEADDAD